MLARSGRTLSLMAEGWQRRLRLWICRELYYHDVLALNTAGDRLWCYQCAAAR